MMMMMMTMMMTMMLMMMISYRHADIEMDLISVCLDLATSESGLHAPMLSLEHSPGKVK